MTSIDSETHSTTPLALEPHRGSVGRAGVNPGVSYVMLCQSIDYKSACIIVGINDLPCWLEHVTTNIINRCVINTESCQHHLPLEQYDSDIINELRKSQKYKQ